MLAFYSFSASKVTVPAWVCIETVGVAACFRASLNCYGFILKVFAVMTVFMCVVYPSFACCCKSQCVFSLLRGIWVLLAQTRGDPRANNFMLCSFAALPWVSFEVGNCVIESIVTSALGHVTSFPAMLQRALKRPCHVLCAIIAVPAASGIVPR